MSELTEVLQAITALHTRGERMALATIVAVTGSTYRGPGARLLIPEDGDLVGNISAGCLEDDVAKVGREVMEEQKPRLMTFDLTAEDEAVWGWGLGCNGVIEVFVEPAERAAEVAESLREAVEKDRTLAAVTVIESSIDDVAPGARVLIRPDAPAQSNQGSLGMPEADSAAARIAMDALEDGRTSTRQIDLSQGTLRAFVEVFEPPPRLLVCGAGHDAIPLVQQAAAIGFRVVVIDDRELFLTKDRFPPSSGFLVADPAQAATTAGVDQKTFAVVMSHNYLRDKEYLRSFLKSNATYIGMLGPRKRTDRLLDELRSEGVEVTERDLVRIHGPAGLDLGSEGPDEIAASIASEILAVRRKRSGGFLRDRDAPIHDR